MGFGGSLKKIAKGDVGGAVKDTISGKDPLTNPIGYATNVATGGKYGDLIGGAVGGATGMFNAPKAEVANVDLKKGPINKSSARISPYSRTRSKQRERSEEKQLGRARSQRQGLIRQLQQQAAGRGPSIAEAQLKQAQDRNLAQQLGAAAAQRGGNAAAQQRQLARQQATSGQDLAQQAMIARMQEQQQAQQQLGQLTGQDQQMAGQLQQRYLQMGMTFDQAQQAANMDLQKLRVQDQQAFNQALLQQQATQAGLATSVAQAQAQQQAGLFGGLGSLGAAFLAKGGKIEGKGEDKKTDSYNDDTVPAMLSPGEIVVPRSVVNKGEKAVSEFVKKLASKETKKEDKKEDKNIAKALKPSKSKKTESYASVLRAQKEMEKRLQALEKRGK